MTPPAYATGTATVTAVLVSHDGERWLPLMLRHLADQRRPPEQVIAVDTGSTDSSIRLLGEALTEGRVLSGQAATFAEAVSVALGATTVPPTEWVWLLHDDSAPAPDALAELLRAAADNPDVDVFGPKLREWPSLRRLLEVGVTISGTGRRETGLERGEQDQGQHDEPRDVLAVNTAGMLVRREVLESMGFEPLLPVQAADLDFGWRAARRGHRVRTAPAAVVFHAEATARGLRNREESDGSLRAAERHAALVLLLVNAALPALPFIAVRLVVGTLLRSLGLLLMRAPSLAWGELRGLGQLVRRPQGIVRARHARARSATVPGRAVRPLLAPWWTPYRHGLDELTELGAAIAKEAWGNSGSRRVSRGRRLGSAAILLLGLVALAVIAARGHLSATGLSGGALLPPPESASGWWSTYLDTTHPLGVGSVTTSPAYVLVLAVLGSITFGSAGLAVNLLFLGAVPLAGWGAHRCLARFTDSQAAQLWGAAAYALALVTSGSVGQGRLGTVVAAALLPWLVASASALWRDSEDRRWRASWRSALWLALISAFAPSLWLVALVLAVGTAAAFLVRGGEGRRALQVLVPVVVAAFLLAPWSVLVWSRLGWSALLLEAGAPSSQLVGPLGPLDFLLGRPGSVESAPLWVSAGLGVVAVLALGRAASRGAALLGWLVALTGLATAVTLNSLSVTLPTSTSSVHVWTGAPLLLVQGAFVVTAAVAASGAGVELRDAAFGWRQSIAVVAVIVGLTAPLASASWWVWHGLGDTVAADAGDVRPEYMSKAAARDVAAGTLVVRGTVEGGVRYELLRRDPVQVGDDPVLPTVSEQGDLSALVSELLSEPSPRLMSKLAGQGVQFILAPAPVDAALVGGLDGVAGLRLSSAGADSTAAVEAGTRAWRLDQRATWTSPDAGRLGWVRPLLLALQALVILAVIVLAAPTRPAQTARRQR